MTSPHTPNTGPQGGGYWGQTPPGGPVPPAPGAPGQPRMAPGPAPLPSSTSKKLFIVGLLIGALVVALVVVGVLWFTRGGVPRTPEPASTANSPEPTSSTNTTGPTPTTNTPGPTSTDRMPAVTAVAPQVIEKCHDAVKQTVRDPVFTHDSATYEGTVTNGDQYWTVTGTLTGTNDSGKTGTFEWNCTAHYHTDGGIIEAWSFVPATPVS